MRIMTEDEQYNEWGVFVGAKVSHYKDSTMIGIVKHIDENLCSVTTCNVCWIEEGGKLYDDSNDPLDWDIQWTNKLTVID